MNCKDIVDSINYDLPIKIEEYEYEGKFEAFLIYSNNKIVLLAQNSYKLDIKNIINRNFHKHKFYDSVSHQRRYLSIKSHGKLNQTYIILDHI